MSEAADSTDPANHWKHLKAQAVVEWMVRINPVVKHLPAVASLTTEEKEVLDHLTAARNAFMKLPHLHPSEGPEMQGIIQQAQYLLATRVAARANPEFWSPRG